MKAEVEGLMQVLLITAESDGNKKVMGCHCSQTKDFEQEEENLIYQWEQHLGYRDYQSSRICTEILVLTVNEKLNWNRLKQLGQVLDLNLSGFEASDEPLSKFYSALKSENAWDSYKLAVVGVLLGKGEPQQKAELLFGFYDKDYAKVVTAAKAAQMVEDLCAVAFDHLPRFTKLSLERQSNSDSAELVQNYMLRLAEAKAETTQYLTTALLENAAEVTLQQFQAKAARVPMRCLFDSRELRILGMQHYKGLLRTQMKHRSQSLKSAQSV